MMKRTLLAAAALLLPGCSTLERYGIGGPPTIHCRGGHAVLDDRLRGPEQARLSFVRRVADADRLCETPRVR